MNLLFVTDILYIFSITMKLLFLLQLQYFIFLYVLLLLEFRSQW